MKLWGVVMAAGKSSRMNGFKPLMELNGFPMIQMTVQSLRNAGIRNVVVITGCRHREMEQALRPLGVRIVENQAYKETDMFASIRMGISFVWEQEKQVDAVFVLPGDIPLVSPESMGWMKRGILEAKEGTQALLPVVKGVPAHPPAVLNKGIDVVLAYKGEGGLRGAFCSMKTEEVVLSEDTGGLFDADYQKDFERISAYAKIHKGVSRRVCESFLEEAEVPEAVRGRCLFTGEFSGRLSERLVEEGLCLDIELCRSGGYLFGLYRERFGGKEAGAFFRKRGYEALAKIMETDGESMGNQGALCKEGILVYRADQWLREKGRMSLEEGSHRLLKEFEVMAGGKDRLYLYE